MFGIAFLPRGLLRAGFPRFNSTIRCSDFPPSIPPHFVSFAWQYQPCACLRSTRRRARASRAGGGVFRVAPIRIMSTGDDGISHVPVEPQCAHARLLDPGGIENARPINGDSMLPSVGCGRRRLPQIALFRGSITRPMHSLSTLRSRGRPNTTQDSLPAAGQLCRAGFNTCRVPTRGFTSMHLWTHSMILLFTGFRGAPAFWADAADVARQVVATFLA
jgi:hypothetical protein